MKKEHRIKTSKIWTLSLIASLIFFVFVFIRTLVTQSPSLETQLLLNGLVIVSTLIIIVDENTIKLLLKEE